MRWSLVIGRFWGTEVRLHASMLLLIPYAMLMYRPIGIEATAKLALLLAALFACVALHEMGHTAAARMLGISVNSIVLWPLGGFANLSRRPNNPLHDILITAAGPFVNLLIFCVLAILSLMVLLVVRWTNFLTVETYALFDWTFPLLVGLLAANLSLVVFNLLPVYPLDGGQITRNLIKMVFGEKRADQVMLVLSLPPALALAVLGFVLGDVIIIITGLLLLIATLSLNPRITHWLTLGWLYVFDRGGYYLRRQDYDPALDFYTKAIERKPNLPGPYVSRAICYMNLMEIEAAKRDADLALALDEKNFIAWALQGELLAMEKAYPEALEAYNKAIAIQPNWDLIYLDRSGLYQEQGKLDLALEDMNRAVDHGTAVGLGHVLRSILFYEMGETEKSRADALRAYRYAPHWMLTFPEIFLSNLVGRMNWAIEYYTRAIEMMPGAYQAYQGRADAARINNHPDWAIADYNRAIALAPKQAELYLCRAKAYLALHEHAQAVTDLQQAVKLANRSHIRRQAQRMLGAVALTQRETATPPAL